MDLVEELDDPCVPISTACKALGLSRATLYRATQPTPPPRMVERGPSARRLSEAERASIREVFHNPEFVDQPVPEVYSALLSRGIYLASLRTMYRVLAETGETRERRNQRLPRAHVSIRCTSPVLHERVNCRHLGAHETKYGSSLGRAYRGMGSKRPVGDGVRRG